MKLAIIGSGYVGLVTGTCLADIGHHVTCVDTDEAKIDLLNSGKSPIFENGLEKLIAQNVAHERLYFTTDLAAAIEDAQAIMIAVGTPEGEDGSADLHYVEQVARDLGRQLSHSCLVIVKSTVPVGTCDLVESLIQEELQKRSVGIKVIVASNPEFLKEGVAIDDFKRPDRIICGLKTLEGSEVLKRIYRPFIMDDPGKLMVMDRRSSELTKYGSNAMLATRISFMNELSRLCEKLGANIDHVRRGMGSDRRIGRKFLYAGPGYGGSCFPKDVAALLRTGNRFDTELSVLDAVTRANTQQKQFATEKVISFFNKDLKGKKLTVWGLAFKPGTDDIRETPSLPLVMGLLESGAELVLHDPEASEHFAKLVPAGEQICYANSSYAALSGSDGLILMTEWGAYRRPNWDKVKSLMRTKNVFDFRNQYDPDELVKLGFHYESIGRPLSTYGVEFQ